MSLVSSDSSTEVPPESGKTWPDVPVDLIDAVRTYHADSYACILEALCERDPKHGTVTAWARISSRTPPCGRR